jgi:hypothetical protein
MRHVFESAVRGCSTLTKQLEYQPLNAGIKSLRATLPDKIFYWDFAS